MSDWQSIKTVPRSGNLKELEFVLIMLPNVLEPRCAALFDPPFDDARWILPSGQQLNSAQPPHKWKPM